MVMMYALCASCTMTLHDSRASLINNRKSIEKFVQNNTLQKVLCSVEFEKWKLNSIPDWSGAEKFGGGYYRRHLTQDDFTAAQQASRAAAAVLKQALERQADQALSDFMATEAGKEEAAKEQELQLAEYRRHTAGCTTGFYSCHRRGRRHG